MNMIAKKNGLVAVVGLPNVGKSTFFNRLIGERKSIVTDIAGTTRDSVFGVVKWQNDEFWLVDTAGITGENESLEMENEIEEQIVIAAEQADVILWMVDGTNNDLGINANVLNKFRRWMKKIILVVNKIDKKKFLESWEYSKLGCKSVFYISSLTGSGTGDLLDEVIKRINKKNVKKGKTTEENFKVCLLGRPNVGKSTLGNTLCGSKERVVSSVPGTTRDVGELLVSYNKFKFILFDTAGMRRMGRVNRRYIERFSIMRTISALLKSDLVVAVIDGQEGLTNRDVSLIGKIEKMKKAMVIFVNKWDLKEGHTDKEMKNFLDILRRKLVFVYWVPVVFGSALTGENVKPLLKTIFRVSQKYNFVAKEESLNDLVFELLTKNERMAMMGLKKIVQISSGPPLYSLKLTNKKAFTENDSKMMEDIIRDFYGLQGVAIKIKLD